MKLTSCKGILCHLRSSVGIGLLVASHPGHAYNADGASDGAGDGPLVGLRGHIYATSLYILHKELSFWQIYGRSHLLGPGQGACHLHLLHLTSQTTSPPPPPPSRWSPPPPPQPNNLTSQQTGHPLHSVHISPHFGGQSTTNVSHGYQPIRNFRNSLRIVFSSHNFNP